MGLVGQEMDQLEGPLRVDTSVGGFRVKRLLGEGAMGEVYLAQDLTLGRRVALKVIKRGVMQGDGLSQFLDEARTTASFSHPHIVTIHAFGEHDGRPFLALEYLDGETMRDRIRTAPLSSLAAMRVMRAVADAVAEAHRHDLVHADLKPENIFLPRDGRVRVLDFGLARTVGASIGASGTPAYMAPERWRGTPMTGAADVWALGLILFELIAGRRPFTDAELATLAFGTRGVELPAVVRSQPWGAIVERCLAFEPTMRPTATEVAQQLAGLLDPAADDADLRRGPFPGLAPFTRADAAHYVGRQAELDALVEQLRTQPLVPITGPSGAGKSSFVHAALTPRLEETGRWLVVSCRPGATPFANLAAAVRGRPDPALAEALRTHPERLSLALGDIARDGARALLFVDQFEELFTLAPTDAHAFCSCLGLAASVDEPWRIVVTVRDDFLGKLAEPPELRPHLGAVMSLSPMGLSDLRAAVTGPLARAGYQSDTPELAARIAADVVGQPAQLPLLQFACQALWQRRDTTAKTILTREYEAIGGAAGALATHAQRLITQLSTDQVRLARTILLALIHPDGTRRPRLRSELLDGLPADASGVVDRLLDGRLIIASREAERDESVLELAHESLATTWPQLARWMDETYEQRLLVLEIEQASLLWVRRGKRDVETWSGAALGEAVRRVTEWNISLPSVAHAFLRAGVDRDARARKRRRWAVGVALGVLGGAAVAATLAALAFSRKEQEALHQQAEIQLAAADMGVFELSLEPFDWDPARQERAAPRLRPSVSWQLRAVELGAERSPGAIYGHDDVRRGTASWHDNALVERIEARSAPAFLEIDRGPGCLPSRVFLQRLPGYTGRLGLPAQLHIAVPTCQASAADTIPIPAGAFYKNANPADGVDTTDQLATLPAFAIDRTEVTRAAFAVYAAMEPLTGDGAARADSSSAPAEPDKRFPVVGINFYTARNYCRFLGKDLPTVEQWQKAFRGGVELDGKPNPALLRVTPWLHPTSPHPTNIAYTDTSEAAPVGSFPDDTSPYGVVDLAGNVAEWSLSRPVPKSLRGLRTVLGAAWDSPPDLKQYEITRRNSRHDRFLDFGIGTRCVSVDH